MKSHYSIASPIWFVRDGNSWDGFTDKERQKYFNQTYQYFYERIAVLGDLNKKLTRSEEKELQYLLETLIDTKKLLRGDR